MKQIRTRYFMLVLYPDNQYHREIMEYLDSDKNPYQGAYILHEPEQDEKKQHWHVMLYFPNARTQKGVCDSFGKANFRRVGENLEPCADTTGIDESEIEVADIVGPALCSPVSDCHAMAMYFLHKNFECIRSGKREYNKSDIKAFHHDYEFTNSLFEIDKVTSQGTELQEIISYIDNKEYNIKTMKDLILTLYINNPQLVSYVEKHGFLIKQLF